jgi:hypothetical protein
MFTSEQAITRYVIYILFVYLTILLYKVDNSCFY